MKFLSKSQSRRFRPGFDTLEDRLTPANNPLLTPPALSSLPSAPASIYLDFTGHFDPTWLPQPNTNIDTPPYDRDGNPNSFNAVEIAEINQIWRQVAEDFSPFRINVTTVQPANFNRKVALRVAIGGNGAWLGAPAGGVAAALDVFGTGVGPVPTCFVFAALTSDTKYLGDTVSHEAGHVLGLNHQSQYVGAVKILEYYPGLPDGTAPIMGDAGNTSSRGLWWYGTNRISSTTLQNDMTILGSATNGFGLRVDDYGDSLATSYKMDITAKTANNFNAKGVITSHTERDLFKFAARSGPITLSITVPTGYNNLDARAQLLDDKGNVLVNSDPAASFNATINYNATYNGVYYLSVLSHGLSAAATPTNYGFNVGTYSVTGTILPFITAVNVYAPLRWTYDAKTGIYSGMVSVVSNVSLTGPYSLTFTLPSTSVQVITPKAVVSGATVTFNFTNNLTANTPFQFLLQLKNPLKVNIGTFYNAFVTKYLYT